MATVYTTHARYVEHNLSGHPEHAGRIRSVWKTLDKAGLTARMDVIEPTPISDDLIRAVHTDEYVLALNWLPTQDHIVQFDHDTYALPESIEIARLSAGGVVQAVDAVLKGEADNGLAAVRPPGHHALPERGMGFCLLGNISIAARYAQKTYGLERVMIVDYDVHHGNGTQDMFYDDDSVLFVSTHQYPFYPGTGAIDEIGTGTGKGYTVNIPLTPGHGDENYAQIYEKILWPLARRFKPQLILISAGFDAHWTDPLAMMRLSLTGYAQLTRELIAMARSLCDGKIVFVLEGGYDLQALGHGVRNIAHALLDDDEISDPLGRRDANAKAIMPLIDQISQLHNL